MYWKRHRFDMRYQKPLFGEMRFQYYSLLSCWCVWCMALVFRATWIYLLIDFLRFMGHSHVIYINSVKLTFTDTRTMTCIEMVDCFPFCGYRCREYIEIIYIYINSGRYSILFLCDEFIYLTFILNITRNTFHYKWQCIFVAVIFPIYIFDQYRRKKQEGRERERHETKTN